MSWQIVSDNKIQISILILRRGALSMMMCCWLVVDGKTFSWQSHSLMRWFSKQWSRSFLTREGLKVFLTAETFSHLEILFAHLEILFGNKVISKFQTFWTGMEVFSDKLPLFAFTETNKVHDLKTNWSSSWSWSSSWIWSRCWQQWITMKPRSDWSSAAPH